MIRFLQENFGTLLVGTVLLVIVIAIIANMVKTKRAGKCIGCSCGCGSADCPHHKQHSS
ncbi:MAG: FeoB-associated Cys-rich membrane protein [Erysipelotrichaceae bacterium]|jgi:hypothetical protein|nr:FeoB-associated Cys-rich membrane protein [Erysipelotrichaceae bacterium]